MKSPHRLEAASKALLIGGLLAAIAAAPAKAITWYVDGASPACSNSGPGDASSPFCTIQKAANRAVAGDNVLVSPALYREQVTLDNAGRQGLPITFTATGPGAIVLGSVDVSRADKWRATSTNAWRRSIDFTPDHVFLDGARLTAAAELSDLTTNSFFFDDVAELLYVDIGGENPGSAHIIEASRRTYGFNIVDQTNIVIEGLEVRNQNSVGVRVFGSSDITLRELKVSFAGTYGVRIDTCTAPIVVKDSLIGDSVSNGILVLGSTGVTLKNNRSYHNGFHGISLQGSSNNLVLKNRSYDNFRWNVRSATGIDISQDSVGNLIQANSVYSNQDSGMQIISGSNSNTVVRNASWINGDHGFATIGSTDTLFISNTAFHNFKDGFSVEGGSRNTTFANNIGVDNGVTTHEFDLYVDDESVSGLRCDFDIFYKTSSGFAIRVNNRSYATLTDFRATGKEENGIDADPLLLGTTESTKPPRLAPGSPAIDSADSTAPGFESEDRDGFSPADDPSVPNSGSGDVTFADRGAFEYDPPPTAALSVSPDSGEIDLLVTANASDSSDPGDTPIVSYTFDFGDGTIMGPASESICSHTYTVPGNYTIVVTVTDKAGQTAVAESKISALDHPPGARLTVSPASGIINLPVTADASASHGSEFTPIVSYMFDFGDGTIVGPQVRSTATHTYVIEGNYTVVVTVADAAGSVSTATASVRAVQNRAPIARLTVSPAIGRKPLGVIADASGSTDTDPAPIASYIFDFGDGTIVGPQTSPTAVHIYRKKGFRTVKVTVTDTAGLSSTSSLTVKVKKKGRRKH